MLKRFGVEYSLRTQSNEELSYDVKVPFELETEPVTNAILCSTRSGKIAVDWGDDEGQEGVSTGAPAVKLIMQPDDGLTPLMKAIQPRQDVASTW